MYLINQCCLCEYRNGYRDERCRHQKWIVSVHTDKETQKLATCTRWVQQNGILCFVPGSQKKSWKFDTGVSKSVVHQ